MRWEEESTVVSCTHTLVESPTNSDVNTLSLHGSGHLLSSPFKTSLAFLIDLLLQSLEVPFDQPFSPKLSNLVPSHLL